MSRNRGKKSSKSRNALPDIPDLETYIQNSIVEVMTERGVEEMGFFEMLILQDYGERQWELFKNLGVDTVIALSTEPSKPWFESAKTDMGGGRFWTDDQLKVIITDIIQQIARGQPFIRKPLYMYWILKIEHNDELKTELIQAARTECSDEERLLKFEQISNRMFREGDFRRMTPAEVAWYVEMFKLGAEPEDRPVIMPNLEIKKINSAKNSCYNVLVPVQPDPLIVNVVRKAVAYGVKLLGAEMAVKKREEDERFSAKELESVKADVAKLALSEETLKRTLEARDKTIHDLTRTIEEQGNDMENLEKQLAKLTKKSLPSYKPLAAERLVLKCLEYARDVKSVEMLADRVLRKENYDDDVVEFKREETYQQILRHLNGQHAIHWTETYLLKIVKNRLKNDYRKPVEIVNRLRNLRME